MRKKIQDMERLSRPREKLQHYGPEKLTTAELLAIILRTGRVGQSVIAVAVELLRHVPESELGMTTYKELARVPGVGKVKALEIIASIALGKRVSVGCGSVPVLSAQQVWERMEDVRGSKKEHFVAFYLNTQNVVLAKEVISVGTINASLIHPREVFEPAVRLLAAAVLVAHNHPAGSLLPSEEDRATTHRLVASGELLGIPLLDHVIVTQKGFYSCKEQGTL